MLDRTHTTEPPTGTFLCRIMGAKLAPTREGFYLEWLLLILDGPHEGLSFKVYTLFTERTVITARTDLDALGYTGSIEDLENILPRFLGRKVMVERLNYGNEKIRTCFRKLGTLR